MTEGLMLASFTWIFKSFNRALEKTRSCNGLTHKFSSPLPQDCTHLLSILRVEQHLTAERARQMTKNEQCILMRSGRERGMGFNRTCLKGSGTTPLTRGVKVKLLGTGHIRAVQVRVRRPQPFTASRSLMMNNASSVTSFLLVLKVPETRLQRVW